MHTSSAYVADLYVLVMRKNRQTEVKTLRLWLPCRRG